MCGRYSLATPWQRLAEKFGICIQDVPELFNHPRFNVAPSQTVPAVRVEANGERHLAALRWGFVPSWSKDGKIAPINAMSATVGDKPMFCSAFRKRRCLVPADGFYEWMKSGAKKQPFHFRLRSGDPFSMAGIWETWHAPDGEIVEGVAVLTTDANELVRGAHDRMPVILKPGYYEEWLDPTGQETAGLERMLRPYPADKMEAVPVSYYVSNARHEGLECLAPMPAWEDVAHAGSRARDRGPDGPGDRRANSRQRS
jgi:putative SOS response-associated peptidase YedK